MSKGRPGTTPDPTPTTSEQPAGPSPVDAIVETWFRETFHNRAIDPDETNRLIAAKDRLKVLLRGVKE